MNEWLYVGLFFIVGLIIPVGAIGVAWILGPKKPNPIKQSTYECGIEPVGDGWVQFKAQYYIFALVFLVFDVETVFLFPWAVKLSQLGLFAVIEGIVFILILIAGLVYTWLSLLSCASKFPKASNEKLFLVLGEKSKLNFKFCNCSSLLSFLF